LFGLFGHTFVELIKYYFKKLFILIKYIYLRVVIGGAIIKH
jgi:hypothetical protein